MADFYVIDLRILFVPVPLHAPVPIEDEFQVDDVHGNLVVVHELAGRVLQHSPIAERLARGTVSIVLKFPQYHLVHFWSRGSWRGFTLGLLVEFLENEDNSDSRSTHKGLLES